MNILVPVDTSECSMRALSHAVDLAACMDGTVHVVHFSEFEDEETRRLESMVADVFEKAGVDGSATIVGDIHLGQFRASNRIGRDILTHAEDHEMDQIVMGHHGTGYAGRLILGSAAKTVVADSTVPVTIIP